MESEQFNIEVPNPGSESQSDTESSTSENSGLVLTGFSPPFSDNSNISYDFGTPYLIEIPSSDWPGTSYFRFRGSDRPEFLPESLPYFSSDSENSLSVSSMDYELRVLSPQALAEVPPQILAEIPPQILAEISPQDLNEVPAEVPTEIAPQVPAGIPPTPSAVGESQNLPEANLSIPSPPSNKVHLKTDLNKLNGPNSVLNTSTVSESDEGSLCTICMDPLTNSGSHRVCCLRCGHIFGHSCVERWIKVGCNNGAKRCPTCNKRACLKDIRVLYLPKVIPLDTLEKDRLIQEKEKLASQKKIVEMELARCKLQNELTAKMYENKITALKVELADSITIIENMSQGNKTVVPNIVNRNRDNVEVKLLHTVDISKDGGCRVLAYDHILNELVVSQPSGNTVFAGFGVRILNTVDFQPSKFVYLHHKMIRDLAFHREDRGLLLSVSLDNTAKLMDVPNSSTVHSFKVDGALWSCCWDATNPHLMFVGNQLGKVYQYDRRMVDTYVECFGGANTAPVVAMVSPPSVARTPFPQGGFISCRLNGVFSYARHGSIYNRQELPLEGPFMSMKYDYTTQTLLTSSRPSSRCPHVRVNLNLVDLDAQGQACLPLIHTFNCGSSARVLSRMTSLPVLQDTLVVAHHESGRTVNMWSSKTGSLAHSFPIKDPIIDLTSMDISNKCLLATLSEKKVCIYKVAI